MPIVFPWLTGSERGLASFKAHTAAMTHISPTWLRIGTDGTLQCNDNPEVAALARTAGVKLVPLVVNEGFSEASAAAILSDPSRRGRVAAALAQKVIEAEWDGINLDFEGPWALRSEYTAFVAAVSARLRPLGKEVSVDVVCQVRPPRGVAGGRATWADPFDYPALGQLVDRVMLMGYDYHPLGGPPGPVGPAWWLRQVLEWTLRWIPADRVVLGLPFYGYHWVVPNADGRGGDVTGAGVEGRYVPFDEAESLRAQAGVPASWDYDALSRHFHFLDEHGRENVIHYDDAASLGRRLQLVGEYRLAGAAFWSLGQEDPAVWDVLGRFKGGEAPASEGR